MVNPYEEPTTSPFFPEPLTTRPAIVEHTSSDSSTTTVSSVSSDSSSTSVSTYSTSYSTSSSSGGDNPYARLVLGDRCGSPFYDHATSSDDFSSRSNSFASSSSDHQDLKEFLKSSREMDMSGERGGGKGSSAYSPLLSSISRWSAPPNPSLASAPLRSESLSASFDSHSAAPLYTFPSAHHASLPSTTDMLRSRSANQRPSSAGTASTSTSNSSSRASFSSLGSSGAFGFSRRPWVRDSDASSVCSAGSKSSALSSGGGGYPNSNPDDEAADGEVFKVHGGESIECEYFFETFYSIELCTGGSPPLSSVSIMNADIIISFFCYRYQHSPGSQTRARRCYHDNKSRRSSASRS